MSLSKINFLNEMLESIEIYMEQINGSAVPSSLNPLDSDDLKEQYMKGYRDAFNIIKDTVEKIKMDLIS